MTKNSKSGSGVHYDALSATDKQNLKQALNRGATRREAIQMMVAAGMTAGVAGSVLTAASDAIAATPKKGGSLRAGFSLHGPDDTFDPIKLTSDADYSRARSHYNSLVQLSDDIVPQPELAESFEASADASEWTFKLRKDVTFHDGSKLSADDVLYSMNRHLGKDSTSVAKGLVSTVKEWKKMGQYEVKAICEAPYADLPAVLGEKHFKICKVDQKDFTNPPGTGPYKLESFKPGVGSKHVRNEDYWREGAHLDSVEIFGITDPIARVSAALSGDVQMITGVNPNAIAQIEAQDGVDVRSTPSGTYMGVAVLANKAPGTDPNVAKALKFLMRRDRIVKTVLKGHGTVGNDHPINVAYGVDFCSDLPIRAFDPDQAKSILAKAGLTSAVLEVAEVAGGATDMALILQRECQKIGFDLQIKKVPTDGYWGAVWQKSPMCVTSWNMRPTASIMLDIAYAPGAPWSDTWWSDDQMGVLLKKVKAETNAQNKHELLCQMQKFVSDNAPVSIPAHVNIVDAMSSKVRGVPSLALGALGASEWPEFTWLDS